MSESMDHQEKSPAYFETSKPPEGVRRINWRLLGAVLAALTLLWLVPVLYTYHDRFNPDYGTGSGSEEPVKVVEVAPSPITMRENEPVARPMQQAMREEKPVAQDALSEAQRRIKEKELTDFEAATHAKARVQNTATNSQHQQYQQQAPSQRGPSIPPSRAPLEPPNMMQPYGMAGDVQYGNQGDDPNQQGQKQEFLNANVDKSPYLKHTRMPQLGITELKTGSIIPGVMISGINSDLPGQITGQVRENVRDTSTGRFVLIPAGSRLVGTYDSGVSSGQERVLIAWNEIIFPDGSQLSLDTMPGADKSGLAGMRDKVDNHYMQVFGKAFLLSLFSAGAQLSQPRGSVNGTFSASQIMSAAIGMQAYSLGAGLIRQGLSRQPTLEIRPGMEFNIMVTKNIVLPPWRGHPMARNVARAEE